LEDIYHDKIEKVFKYNKNLIQGFKFSDTEKGINLREQFISQ
jgi:hypothetical protein